MNEILTRQGFASPYSTETRIEFELPESGDVSLRIYNSSGEEIRTLASGLHCEAGKHVIPFDAAEFSGRTCMYRLSLDTVDRELVVVKRLLSSATILETFPYH